MVAKTVTLPNIRKMFIPDKGYILIDCDLKQADAQVVAWEANDDKLKAVFRDPNGDLHNQNSLTIFGNVTKQHRQYAKQGVHLTNYGGKPPTLARTLGISLAVAKQFQAKWFAEHTGILDWHRRVEHDLQTKRFVQNQFGNIRYYFSRISSAFTEALAWIPQSTVALVISRGVVAIDETFAETEVKQLAQVHDSWVFQVKESLLPGILPAISEVLHIKIPYDDPLIIPVDLSMSEISWGHVEAYNWDGTKKEKAK